MASAAVLGKGLTMKDSSNNAIAEIVDMGEFGESSADIDVTNMDTSGNFMEYIAGLREGGEIPVTCNFKKTDTSGQIALITDCQNGTRDTYTITFASGATWAALMHPKSYKIKPPVKEQIKIAFVFKVDGQPTFSAGS